MILSIHIPKTAGRSFQARLEAAFGKRLACDYGDWVGYEMPEVIQRREARAKEMLARRVAMQKEYDIIYGHFCADKYINVFSQSNFVAFFRDPYQRVISNYEYLMRHPELENPGIRAFHEAKLSLIEFIAWCPPLQSLYLGSLRVDDLAVVGLTEEYERSVALFGAVLGVALPPATEKKNANPSRPRTGYAIIPDVRRAIDAHHSEDIELYRRARERFSQLARRHGL